MTTLYNCQKKVTRINKSQQIGLSFAVELPAEATEGISLIYIPTSATHLTPSLGNCMNGVNSSWLALCFENWLKEDDQHGQDGTEQQTFRYEY